MQAEGKNLEEIGEELDIDATTVARNLQNSKTGKMQVKPESETGPEIEAAEAESGEAPEADREQIPESNEAPAEETLEPDPQPEADDTPAAEEEPTTPDPEPIPDDIINAARAVMGAFAETRPDSYVARFEASASEWMTITDDSLPNELERELLTSAVAMCLWQEWMIWYQGERTSAFTAAFGKMGTVFVRGRSGQWTIVSRLRSMLKRLWA